MPFRGSHCARILRNHQSSQCDATVAIAADGRPASGEGDHRRPRRLSRLRDALLVPALGVMILAEAPCVGARLFLHNTPQAVAFSANYGEDCVPCAGLTECLIAWAEYLASLATGQQPDYSIYDACFEEPKSTTTTTP